MAQLPDLYASPPPPLLLLKTSLYTSPTSSSPLFLHDPTRSTGSADFLARGHMRRPWKLNADVKRICRQSGACFVRLCVLSHRVCSAVPTTNFETEHATEMVAQRAPRVHFGAPKAPREPKTQLRKLSETLPNSSWLHPGVPLRTWNSPKQAQVAPERAGPRFPTTCWTSLSFT